MVFQRSGESQRPGLRIGSLVLTATPEVHNLMGVGITPLFAMHYTETWFNLHKPIHQYFVMFINRKFRRRINDLRP